MRLLSNTVSAVSTESTVDPVCPGSTSRAVHKDQMGHMFTNATMDHKHNHGKRPDDDDMMMR